MINPSYVVLGLEDSDSRKGFNEGYYISGAEGNVPWVWTVLGENSGDLKNMIDIELTDESTNNRELRIGLDFEIKVRNLKLTPSLNLVEN